jgi:hypothetical protein
MALAADTKLTGRFAAAVEAASPVAPDAVRANEMNAEAEHQSVMGDAPAKPA